MINFSATASDSVITVTTPTVEFSNAVPTSFINEFIRRMGKGQIRVYDAKGNELKVYYGSLN